MKKALTFFLLVGAMTACSDLNNINAPQTEIVPQNVSSAIRKAYPEATELTYSVLETDKIWVSAVMLKIQRMSVVVNSTGQITETYNVARVGATLPESARKYIATNYPGASIGDINEQINDDKKVIGYKVSIKTKEGKEVVLLFDTTGSLTLLITKDDTSNTPTKPESKTYTVEQKDLPEAIKKVLAEKHGEYKYLKGAVIVEEGKRTYFIVVSKDMTNYEYAFDVNGTILKSSSSGMVVQDKTQKELAANSIPNRAKEYLDKTYKGWEYMKGLIFYEKDKITGYIVVVKQEGKLYYVYFDGSGAYQKTTDGNGVEISQVQERVIEAKDILSNSKEYLTKNYVGWTFVRGVAKLKENKIYQYLLAIKIGDTLYYVTFDGEGKFLEAKRG
ncbi:MAG: PepSY-like domain-containing protein [Spirosomataceae bacterium]